MTNLVHPISSSGCIFLNSSEAMVRPGKDDEDEVDYILTIVDLK